MLNHILAYPYIKSLKKRLFASTFLSVAATALVQLRPVARKLRDIRKAAVQAIEQIFMKCVVCGRKMIMHPKSFAPRLHQSRAPQIGQVAGDLWLRLVQNGDNITNTKFALGQQVENPQAGMVGKCAKHQIDELRVGFNRSNGRCFPRLHVITIYAMSYIVKQAVFLAGQGGGDYFPAGPLRGAS